MNSINPINEIIKCMKTWYKNGLPIRWEPIDKKIPMYLNIAHSTQKRKKKAKITELRQL